MKKKYWNESPAEIRFWKFVDKNGPTQPSMASPCWIWTGGFSERNYGRFWNKKMVYAHRFSYELVNGPLPPKYWACHHCDNPPCVNPDHLFSGTDSDNRRDAVKKDRLGSAKLTTAQVKEIRKAHAAGIAVESLAILLKLHVTTIRCVVRRKTWDVVQ